jgi:hypothetical protein
MFKPRLTVRSLMIAIAVFGLLLGSGVFAVRCYQTSDYARREVQKLNHDIEFTRYWIGLCKKTNTKLEGIEDCEHDLIDYEKRLQEANHLRRHPWHGIPDDDE